MMSHAIDSATCAPTAAPEPPAIDTQALPHAQTSPRLLPQTGPADAYNRERLTPPRRPSPLGPGLQAPASPDLPPFRATPPSDGSPSSPPIRPHGVFGRRASRRASDAPQDMALSLVQNDALKSALRDRFIQGRDQRRPISAPAVALLRPRVAIELDSDNPNGERWIAVRFADAYYVAVMPAEAEPNRVWYYVGDWPYSVQSNPLEP